METKTSSDFCAFCEGIAFVMRSAIVALEEKGVDVSHLAAAHREFSTRTQVERAFIKENAPVVKPVELPPNFEVQHSDTFDLQLCISRRLIPMKWKNLCSCSRKFNTDPESVTTNVGRHSRECLARHNLTSRLDFFFHPAFKTGRVTNKYPYIYLYFPAEVFEDAGISVLDWLPPTANKK